MSTVKDPIVERYAGNLEQAELHLQVLPKNVEELDEPTVMDALTRLAAVKRLIDSTEYEADSNRRRRQIAAVRARYAKDPDGVEKLDKAEAALVRIEGIIERIAGVAKSYRAVKEMFDSRRDALYQARKAERMVPITRFVKDVSIAYGASDGQLSDKVGPILHDGIAIDWQATSYGLEIIDLNRDRVSISWPRDTFGDIEKADVSWSSGSSRNGIEAARHYAHLIRLAALVAEMADNAGLVAP